MSRFAWCLYDVPLRCRIVLLWRLLEMQIKLLESSVWLPIILEVADTHTCKNVPFGVHSVFRAFQFGVTEWVWVKSSNWLYQSPWSTWVGLHSVLFIYAQALKLYWFHWNRFKKDASIIRLAKVCAWKPIAKTAISVVCFAVYPPLLILW